MIKESIQIVGLGQCGGRIGQEFENIGLDTVYINSDEIDMRGLSGNTKNKLLITTSGTGGSPLKGAAILEANHDKFTKFMSENMDPAKLQLFVAGGGGGTGGGFVKPAIEFAKSRGFKVGTLFTLPTKMMGPLAASNALATLKGLKQVDMNLFLLADNEFLVNKVGLSSTWWTKVNQYIVSNVASVFDIVRPGKITHSGLGSIDKGEVLRILQSGKGETDIRSFYIDIKDFEMDDTELKKRLFEPGMVAGYDYKTTLSYLVGIDTPIKGSYTEQANRIFNITKKVCGSALSRPGMMADPMLTGSLRVTLMNSGLKLPKVIQSNINNLKRDEARYNDKVHKEEKINLNDAETGFMNESFDL